MITFISSINFIQSAEWLDKKRVWKQVLEARQLRERLDLIKWLSNYYGLIHPSREDSPKKKYDFIRLIMKKLRQKKQTAIWSEDHQSIEYVPQIKQHPNRVKWGHIYHVIVPLWMGYEDALDYYIFVHHEECLKRKIKSKLSIIPVDEPEEYPLWISSIVPSHQRILLRKLPEAYPQWSDLEPLDKLDWEELYQK